MFLNRVMESRDALSKLYPNLFINTWLILHEMAKLGADLDERCLWAVGNWSGTAGLFIYLFIFSVSAFDLLLNLIILSSGVSLLTESNL